MGIHNPFHPEWYCLVANGIHIRARSLKKALWFVKLLVTLHYRDKGFLDGYLAFTKQMWKWLVCGSSWAYSHVSYADITNIGELVTVHKRHLPLRHFSCKHDYFLHKCIFLF